MNRQPSGSTPSRRSPWHPATLALVASLVTFGPAFAQEESGQEESGTSVLESDSHDTRQPIQISSDTLEVKQDEQVAVFAGNVDAIQGDIRLRADIVQVYYVADGEDQAPTSDSISSMRADGNVFVTSPSETAQGEWATYDVVSRVLTLYDNVLLTKGDNVLCGKSLDLNFETGRSVLKGGCKTSSGSGTRVQGLFFPSESKEE